MTLSVRYEANMRLYKRPDTGYWFIEYGRGKRTSLKTKDAALAKAAFAKIKREAAKGRLIELTGGSTHTLGAFVDEWERLATGATSTIRSYRLSLGKLESIAGRTIRLDALGPHHLDKLVAECRRSGCKATAINVYIRSIRAALSKAVAWGWVKVHPFAKAKELPRDRKPPKFLAGEDVARFLASVRDTDFRRLIAAFIATGRRRSELLALRWDDIDFERGQYLVRRSKTHLSRWYPISGAFGQVLRAIGGGEGRVFSRWEHPDTLSHAVKAMLTDYGRPDLRLHDLRHTYAVRFIEAGGGLRVLQDLLGHTESRTTEIYAHVSDAHLKREADRVNFGGPVEL